MIKSGRRLQLISASAHFVREHGFEYISLKDEEDKKSLLKPLSML